ncbi:putative addiction module component [Pseudobythopirellula maris]|uniref:Putative addiction module component n=1 Tax=Pseudobythopirellula maris TaxID=2527991 RepID=A0A5C5ZRM6_9BACT|nr:addiction module protein [Pseudobythopirellula maris]TWT89950.1 putative addiction module component [Pseudobythopirellula maris]
MSISNDDLFSSALALPPDRRADLANRLLDSLAAARRPKLSDDEIAQEVQRRSAEMDSGEVIGIPWSEVRAELRSRISRKSES